MKNLVAISVVLLVCLGFAVADVHVWKGSVGPNGRNWDNPDNWVGTTNTIPWWDDDVIIPSTGVVQYPLLNVHAGVKNLTIEPSASIDLGPNMFFIQKNINNQGSLLAVIGTLVFYGSEISEVDGSLNIANLTILKDNLYSVHIANDLTVDGVLNLEQGLLESGTTPIVLGPSATVTGNYGEVNGSVMRLISGAGTWQFTNRMTSLTSNAGQSAVTVTVTSHPGATIPNGDPSLAIRRYYNFNVTGGALSATVRLAYRDSELNGLVETNLISFRYFGSSWQNLGGIVNCTDNYIDVPDVSIFDMFTLGQSSTPLPIQLSHFSVTTQPNSNNVELTWGTLTETNNYGFYVQQSIGTPTSFVELPNSFVPGHGTTIEPHEYRWIHNSVAPGTYYYRLKQVDLDGTTHYTDAREVTISSPTGVSETSMPAKFQLAQNYPNPFNPSTQIQFTVEKQGFTTLTVFDILGREMGILFSGVAEPGKLYAANFDASTLTNGTYFYKLVNNNESSMRKMLLLK